MYGSKEENTNKWGPSEPKMVLKMQMEPPQSRCSFTCRVESDSHQSFLVHDWVWVDSDSADFSIHHAGCSMVADTWTDSMGFCRVENAIFQRWSSIHLERERNRDNKLLDPNHMERLIHKKTTRFIAQIFYLEVNTILIQIPATLQLILREVSVVFQEPMPCPYLAHMTIKFLHNRDNRPPMCFPSDTLIFSKMRLKVKEMLDFGIICLSTVKV